MRVARLVHRLASLAYPPVFRRDFGADLDRVFVDRLSQAAARSRGHAVLWFVFLIADVVSSGLAERAHGLWLRWAWPSHAPTSPAHLRLVMLFETLVGDFRLALRQFRHWPLFAILTTLSLAVGIGSSTAIFSVVNAVLLRPLPYAAPEQLVAIWSDNTKQTQPSNPVSPANYEAFRKATSFTRAEAMFSFLASSQIQVNGEPDYIQTATITPGMFDLLGVHAVVGSTFRDGEAAPRVVISYDYWQRRFSSDASVVGRLVTFPGAPAVAIAGVMPRDFVFPYRSMLGPSGFTTALEPDMWLPLVSATSQGTSYLDTSGQPNRTVHFLSVIGRLAPGVSLDRARTELRAIASERATAYPDTNAGWNVTLRPLHDQTVGAIRPALLILLAGVAVVLLITCVNLAHVLLARASARRQDLSIRSALGASGWRLTQQALVESLTLGLAGGLVGLALTLVGIRALVAVAPPNLPRIGEVSLDTHVALFALLLSLATGVVVGLLPAIAASRTPAASALRESRRTTASAGRRRMRSALIVAEVGLAMVLAVGAGLLIRSFVAVLGVDPGFASSGLLTMQLNMPQPAQQNQAARLAFYDALESQLKAIPGVTAVGGTTRLPLGSTSVSTTLNVEGRDIPPNQMPDIELRRAVFDYFDAMGIPVVRGRAFASTDTATAPIVGVVNTALVAKIFPNEDPIGRRVRLGPQSTAPFITIVGIIGSVRHGSLEEAPRPELYLTYRQNAPIQPFIVLRTAADPASLASAAREAVRAAGAGVPFDVKTMLQVRDGAVAERRFVLWLVALFGAMALALSAIGVYGVVTLVAAERAAEVGIRMALGARPTQVLTLLLSQASKLALAGVAIGGALSLFLAPSLSSQFFGVTASDPATYATVAAALLATSVLAAFMPARRAMKTAPALTLK